MSKIAVFAAVIFIVLIPRAYSFDDGDFQVWHIETQEFRLNDKAGFTLEEELRWGDNARQLYQRELTAGFFYNLSKYFDAGINYKYIYLLKSGDKFTHTNEPQIDVIGKYTIFGIPLENRCRFEYADVEKGYGPDFWTYRNRFTIKSPWKMTKFAIQPYIAQEAFVVLDGGGNTRNRVFGGMLFKVSQNIKGELFYMLQCALSSGEWKEANILGSRLKVSF